MLRALKNQLTESANQDRARFLAFVSERVQGDGAAALADSLRNFILTMPEMIAQVRAWTNEPAVPSPVKGLQGFLLTYLYHPYDFVPDETLGLRGYLDDAYVVGWVYKRTMESLDHEARRALAGAENIEREIANWLSGTRRVLPQETRLIDGMLSELLDGKTSAFDALMGRQAPS